MIILPPDLLSKVNILENEPLREHTSFRIGGNATRLIEVSAADAPALVAALTQAGEKYAFLGRGTNVLVRDEGYRGTVLRLKPELPARDGVLVTASGGTTLAAMASFALECGLSGLEFAHGIPGTVGGGVMMNAGAYGGEISGVLVSTDYCTPAGEVITLTAPEHNFGYRHSFFKDHPDFLILRSTFRLAPKNPDEIKAQMSELSRRRRESQPLNLPSAGSTFKRPEGHFAGKLIEECGLKGCRVGGAEVSLKHAGFVVNVDNATCSDVLDLITHVQTTVYNTFGVKLEREVKIFGEE